MAVADPSGGVNDEGFGIAVDAPVDGDPARSVGADARERIAERIADAKAKDRADGRFLGGSRPFGWGKAEDGETMVPVPAEQAAIAKAKEMREAGASLRAIAAALQDDGHDVSHVTAGKLVKRPAA